MSATISPGVWKGGLPADRFRWALVHMQHACIPSLSQAFVFPLVRLTALFLRPQSTHGRSLSGRTALLWRCSCSSLWIWTAPHFTSHSFLEGRLASQQFLFVYSELKRDCEQDCAKLFHFMTAKSPSFVLLNIESIMGLMFQHWQISALTRKVMTFIWHN